jgi:uncharacterized YigZ family protein
LLLTEFKPLDVTDDTYQTIEKPSEGIYKDKGSKFLAFAYPITNENELKIHLELLKKDHHSARHHCWAYRIGKDGEQWRANDDGEPSNSAGKPILGQLQSKNVTNIGVIVVRYFGGTLLGVSGLMQAYKEATIDALQNATFITLQIESEHTITFPFEAMNEVMKIMKESTAKIVSQQFDNNCKITFRIRKMKEQQLLDKIQRIEN